MAVLRELGQGRCDDCSGLFCSSVQLLTPKEEMPKVLEIASKVVAKYNTIARTHNGFTFQTTDGCDIVIKIENKCLEIHLTTANDLWQSGIIKRAIISGLVEHKFVDKKYMDSLTSMLLSDADHKWTDNTVE